MWVVGNFLQTGLYEIFIICSHFSHFGWLSIASSASSRTLGKLLLLVDLILVYLQLLVIRLKSIVFFF
jgi:hypothetical protein